MLKMKVRVLQKFMNKEEIIKKLDLEIKAIDEVNNELMDDIKKIELSIAKKELILKRMELEELLNYTK